MRKKNYETYKPTEAFNPARNKQFPMPQICCN